jgi:1-deoxyxylulose-5-phosphate synthase
MHYLAIPGISTPVSCLVMGTMVMQPGQLQLGIELLDDFVEAGGTTLDTARVYGSEEQVGKWPALRDNREGLVVVGKGCHPDPEQPTISRVGPEYIQADLASSLEAMNLDYLDLYMLHRDDPDVPVGEIIDALNEQQAAGLIHALGVSNWTTTRIIEANDYAAKAGRLGIAASSTNLALAKPNEPQWEGSVSIANDAAALAWHDETQIPVLAWSSQARGFFSTRTDPDSQADPDLIRVWYSERNFERKRRATQIADERGATASQIALAWVLNQTFPTAALIGPATLAEAAESYGALDLTLTPEEIAWLDLEPDLTAA